MAQTTAGHTTHAGHEHAPQAFIWRYVFSKDHKVIGIQYYLTAMVMAWVAGILAMLIRLQLAWPEKTWPVLGRFLKSGFSDGVMNPEFYAMLFTMHGTIMVFFVLSTAPVSGFGNLLIPLQCGARDMAFPFLNALSYWTFLPGCLIILTSPPTRRSPPCATRFPARRPGRPSGSSAWSSSSPPSPWAA